MRWRDYVMGSGGSGDDPEALWEAASVNAEGKQSMYVLGVGFDPRALVGLQRFLALEQEMAPIVGLVELPPPSPMSGALAIGLAEQNRTKFEEMVATVEVRTVVHQDTHARNNAGPRIARELTKPEFMFNVGHLIIDVSSLPSRLYFPIIAASLDSLKAQVGTFPTEVQVVACENPQVDGAITELGISEAEFLGGFRGRLALESQPKGTVIWAPVVDERSREALVAIHTRLSPDDVFPVLPFPSSNPRRADNLILEHQVELLDIFQIDPVNVIYADERNPFDLYRTLSRLQINLIRTFTGADSPTLVLSTPTSKLLSIGVLLAVYEYGLPVISAPPDDYEFDDLDISEVARNHSLTCLWLAGLPDTLASVSVPNSTSEAEVFAAPPEVENYDELNEVSKPSELA